LADQVDDQPRQAVEQAHERGADDASVNQAHGGKGADPLGGVPRACQGAEAQANQPAPVSLLVPAAKKAEQQAERRQHDDPGDPARHQTDDPWRGYQASYNYAEPEPHEDRLQNSPPVLPEGRNEEHRAAPFRILPDHYLPTYSASPARGA
jgi:hypothetical protein